MNTGPVIILVICFDVKIQRDNSATGHGIDPYSFSNETQPLFFFCRIIK